MSAGTHALAFVAGLVATAAVLGLVAPGSAPEPVVAAPADEEPPPPRWVRADCPEEPPPPRWVRADCPEEPDRGRDLTEGQEALAALEDELDAMAAYEEEATGAPLEWPDPVPPGFDEVSVADALDAIAAETGAAVVGIDCGEFPCVAVLGVEGDDPEQTTALREQLDEAFPDNFRTGMWWTGEDGQTIAGGAVMVAITPTTELDEAATERIGFRLQEIDDIFSPVDFFGSATDP